MNFKELAERLGLEEAEFMELAQLFVETGSSDLSGLQAAIEQEDMQEVVERSHSIKGASGNLGFMEIYEIAKKVELNAREDSLDGASVAVTGIREKIEQIDQAIK